MDILKKFNVNLDKQSEERKRVLLALNDLREPDQIVLSIYANSGSYSKAAELLGVTKSAVSNRILKIKKQLNVK